MLRSELDHDKTWRVSSGTAVAADLLNERVDVLPTTAYLMLGERCQYNCAFCAQAHGSRANEAALSRVLWPQFPITQVIEAVSHAYTEGTLRRACFQVTVGADSLEETLAAVLVLHTAVASIPICASVSVHNMDDVAALLEAGADRVTLSLDAAAERIHKQVKSGSWERTWHLLREASATWPGHIGTHVIAGLGETEQEMAETLQQLVDLGVSIGLFAFTPLHGTPMANQPPPALDSYRRIQAARWLMIHHHVRVEAMSFDGAGCMTSLGLSSKQLAELLADGEAFRTAGCPDCNRPYYNERPAGPIYNYPAPLTAQQASQELDLLLANLSDATSLKEE